MLPNKKKTVREEALNSFRTYLIMSTVYGLTGRRDGIKMFATPLKIRANCN